MMTFLIGALSSSLICYLACRRKADKLERHHQDSLCILEARHKRKLDEVEAWAFEQGSQHTASLYDMFCETKLPWILDLQNFAYGHKRRQGSGNIKLQNLRFKTDLTLGINKPVLELRFCGVDMRYASDGKKYNLVIMTPFMAPETKMAVIENVHPSNALTDAQRAQIIALFVAKSKYEADQVKARNKTSA